MALPFTDNWRDTALAYAPVLLLDRCEPFFPVRAGVTFFDRPAPSPSFDRNISFDPAQVRFVVEYAIYYDYDIQHIYDLEHVWVYVGPNGEVVSGECSFHGQYWLGLTRDRSNLEDGRRPRLYVQPGKHAMAPLEEVFHLVPNLRSCCLEEAGDGGVLEPQMFRGQFKSGEGIDALAERHLRGFSFRPSFEYAAYAWPSDALVPWDELRAEIPARLKPLLAGLDGASA